MEKKLKPDVTKEMDNAKATIMQLLEREIVSAYYGPEGVARNALRSDKFLKEALELLDNIERYREILRL